jgi:hypothetical protein
MGRGPTVQGQALHPVPPVFFSRATITPIWRCWTECAITIPTCKSGRGGLHSIPRVDTPTNLAEQAEAPRTRYRRCESRYRRCETWRIERTVQPQRTTVFDTHEQKLHAY